MLKGSVGGSKSLDTSFGINDDAFSVAPHMNVVFYCENGHETKHAFAAEALKEVPQVWQCEKCGWPAGVDKNNIPKRKKGRVYKTHWEYLMERRTMKFGERLLNERLKIING